MMKAARLTGIRKLELNEVPEPRLINDTDVLLKLKAAGICGSDIHYYLQGKIGNQSVSYPFTVGHESVAVVEKIGRNVDQIKPGDRVVADPAIACGLCDQCRRGRPHTCLNLRFLGCPGQLEGCLSEYIVMPKNNCYPINDDTTSAQGVLVEPLAIGVYSLRFLKNTDVQTIGILGSGPIGLSVALTAQTVGIREIFMTDKIDERLKAAREAGAVWTGNPDKSDIVRDIQFLQPLLLDAVFECCGDPSAIDQAADLLKPGGQLLIIGIPDTDRISFDIHNIRRKEIRIQNVRRQNDCFRSAIDLIEKKKVDVNFMATHTLKFQSVQEAFELVADYKDGVIKAIIQFD